MDAAKLSTLVDTLQQRRHRRVHELAILEDNPQLTAHPNASRAVHQAHIDEIDFVLGALEKLLPEG